MKQYFVYILTCADGTYYTGITHNVTLRFRQHQTGGDPSSYTHFRRPVKLSFTHTFKDVKQAIAFEKQVKRWSRAKKEALINDNWDALPQLAKKKNFKK